MAAAELLTVPVGRRDTIQLYVNHIGTVTDGAEESVSMAKLNGSTAVGIDIMKQSGTNTVQVVDDIKKTLVNIRKDLPPGVELILVRDNSVKICESVNDVLFNGTVVSLRVRLRAEDRSDDFWDVTTSHWFWSRS